MAVTLSGYQLGQVIYTGTRTLVFQGQRESDNQPVVIKFLRNDYPTFSELLQFRNQYTIAKNLNLPGIICPDSLESYGNSYALVMEDFGGISLREYSQTHSLELIEVLTIALQLAEILHNLHASRVIHKDIKPANILIHPESKQVKLIDFSIASLLPKETQEIQNPNILEGTLAYLAPEQTGRMNRGIDYRADFYALGVTLYELLTGQLPFESDDPMELVHCHIAKVPVPVQQVNPSVPSMVAEIVSKLMAKNAEDRYQSALGLQHDLQQCLIQCKETGSIADFELGQRDLSDRFLIPEKLYGREQEVQTLLDAFARVSQGTSELLLVAGFSGIGKTAIVNEVHKPITRQKGYFIKGKFDQFNRNIPLSAFVQALRDLMGQLLSESDAQLAQWKAQILSAVGENGQVLVEVLPELERIIGQQPAAAELSGTAAQNRFNLLFQKFIQVFTTASHPLVIFLDDLQWADLASLQLLKVLMDDNGYLLVLGAYRDNEVSPAHPLMLTIEELQKADTLVNTMTLAPLALEHTNHLIADTLKCDRQLAKPLTQLVDRKTQGNPFFTTQFLKALHEEDCITFVREATPLEYRDRGYWQCDMAQVNALALTDDVVEFMALQLQKLPEETQQVLKLAACIGNQFDLATLAIVSEKSTIETAIALWRALQEGLILPNSQVYKFFQTAEADPVDERQMLNPAYRFLHDRVQQAAYSLIPERDLQLTHLSIGQLLLDKTPAEQLEEKLFAIVGHLNSSRAKITVPTQIDRLVQLNQMAANKAKAATAYQPALQYLNVSLELLPPDSWQTAYDLTLTLYTEAVDVAYLSGDFKQMQQRAEVVLQSARTLLDRVRVYDIQILAYVAQDKQLEAISTGLHLLELLGYHFPEAPSDVEIHQALTDTAALIAATGVESLGYLPHMTDANSLAAMQILSTLGPTTFISRPTLFPLTTATQVQLSIRQGNSTFSAYAYACYGILLCCDATDIELGTQISHLAMELLSQFADNTAKSKTLLIVAKFIWHWRSPLKDTLSLLQSAYQISLHTGAIEYVAWSLCSDCEAAYILGYNLIESEQKVSLYQETIQKFKHEVAFSYCGLLRQVLLNLIDHSAQPCQLVGAAYDEAQYQKHYQAVGDSLALFTLYTHKLILCYLFGEFSQALENAILAMPHCVNGITAHALVSPFNFYNSLARLALYSSNNSSSVPADILDSVATNQQKMQHWAYHAPMNHQHRYELVEAERYRVAGDRVKAIEYYDRAILGAKTNKYIQEEALANELAAKFYLDWGKEKVAAGYMQEAYYCYAKWGAKAKTRDLEQRYPNLLHPILQPTTTPLNVLETLATITAPNRSIHASTKSSHTSSTDINIALDFAAILKASQALSSTIQLDELLRQLTQIILQNSGGNCCALIIPNAKGNWQVKAIATSESVELCTQPLEGNSNLPIKLIQYVKNTQETVIIDDFKTDLPVIDNYLSEWKPKSILCLPILNQGHPIGIVYLKNQATSGVFTSDRVVILNFLCTQAAISLENARLYQKAQNYAQQLEQSQLQLVQNEKMSALGNLIAGVAHEINNPIGCIVGNINAAQDYINDLLGLIDLYQEELPQPSAQIEEELDAIDLDYIRDDLPKLIQAMQDGGDRITAISKSLRTFSRADSDSKQPFNLHEGIDSTVLILRHRLKANEHRPAIEVITDYGKIPEIPCFPGQLNQVFMNIMANAIDALDESNSGRSFAETQANPNIITVKTSVKNKHVEISITDNGKGMSEEVKQKIFDHLFTTKGVGKGTGLGLAIARQIVVEKHGGKIEVKSTLGAGTEFTLALPIE